MDHWYQIALLEEQKDEAAEAEQVEDEDKPSEADIMTTDLNSKADDIDEKPDINDVPVEENEVRHNTFCSLIYTSLLLLQPMINLLHIMPSF